MSFECAYCLQEYESFVKCIEHGIHYHANLDLCYRRTSLNCQSGELESTRFRLGIIPSDTLSQGTIIVPIEQTQEVYVSSTVLDSGSQFDTVVRKNPPAASIPNTSITEDPVPSSVITPQENYTDTNHRQDVYLLTSHTETASEVDDNYNEKCQRFIERTPNVLQHLRNNGMLDIFCMLWELLERRRFPMDNICLSLFADVVKWYGSESSTTTMRYSVMTKLFWRTGYKLFKGKFLKFMGGFKNIGNIIAGQCKRGIYNPMESRINFAVPSLEFLNESSQTFSADCIRPGILEAVIDKEIAIRGTSNVYKLCVDGMSKT